MNSMLYEILPEINFDTLTLETVNSLYDRYENDVKGELTRERACALFEALKSYSLGIASVKEAARKKLLVSFIQKFLETPSMN